MYSILYFDNTYMYIYVYKLLVGFVATFPLFFVVPTKPETKKPPKFTSSQGDMEPWRDSIALLQVVIASGAWAGDFGVF